MHRQSRNSYGNTVLQLAGFHTAISDVQAVPDILRDVFIKPAMSMDR